MKARGVDAGGAGAPPFLVDAGGLRAHGAIDIARLIRQIPSQYPFVLVDRVLEHDPEGRLVALKNVTGSEEFFEGHFPGEPVMPGVLLMESLAQAAGHLAAPGRRPTRAGSRSTWSASTPPSSGGRRCPGDQLRLEVQVLRRRGRALPRAGRGPLGRAPRGRGQPAPAGRDAAAAGRGSHRARGRRARCSGRACAWAPTASSGPQVRIGADTVLRLARGDRRRHRRSARDNHLFPFCSVGLAPQDLKYQGEPTRLVIGDRNVIREFVTIHRGTAGGGGLTRIGYDNLFMAYAHVAHDCQVGSHTIFAQRRHAGRPRGGGGLRHHRRLLGRPPVLPGGPARLRRRLHGGHQGRPAVLEDGGQPRLHLRREHGGPQPPRLRARRRSPPSASAYRVLLQSRLNTTRGARAAGGGEPTAAEVRALVDFIRSAPARRDPEAPQPAPSRGGRVSAAAARPREPRGPLGLIAGNGRFPFLVADGARRAGRRVVAVAIREEASPELAARVDAMHWVGLGQLGRHRRAEGAGVSEAVMAGQVKHRQIFSGVVPDLKIMARPRAPGREEHRQPDRRRWPTPWSARASRSCPRPRCWRTSWRGRAP